jgi:pyruvate/2-oxoglutarate dehydrogenase complex dihydrolipoamide acyltransferase (E2) component
MKNKKGYKRIPLSFNRRAVIASASVTKEKNAIHSLTKVDITEPRRLIKEHFDRTGEKLSLTAYIVTCLAQVIKENPELNSFIKGKRLILLDDVTVSVLIEREIIGEKVPEPIGIQQAQLKTFLQIHNEIRAAKKQQSDKLGSLSGLAWIRMIPNFLFKTFIRIADKNINMAKRYGKVAVTAVGMFSKEAVWFIPHGSATVLVTVGSISKKVIEIDGHFVSREHLCLTFSFDHNIVDGAPASRFINQLTETIKSGDLIRMELEKP